MLLSSWCVLDIILKKKKEISFQCVNFLIQSLGQPNEITVTTTQKNEAKRSEFPGF